MCEQIICFGSYLIGTICRFNNFRANSTDLKKSTRLSMPHPRAIPKTKGWIGICSVMETSPEFFKSRAYKMLCQVITANKSAHIIELMQSIRVCIIGQSFRTRKSTAICPRSVVVCAREKLTNVAPSRPTIS